MKWFSGTVAGFFLGLIFLITFIAFRAGVHLPVEVEISKDVPYGPHSLLYKEVVGPYHEVATHIIEMEDFAKSQGIICTRTFGHYLDDPNGVDHNRLRSHVGCLFPSSMDFSDLTSTTEFQEKAYKTGSIVFDAYVKGTFDGSPALGAIKIYPKILKAAREQNLSLNNKAFEVYEVKSSKNVRTQVYFQILQ